ncbi:MAG: potassium channel family protein [Methanobacterium sp.]
MHIVIMGSGIFGLNLASLLISDGHDVTVIENDERKCDKIALKLDAAVLYGNGTDIEILDESNVGESDVFVAATENDDFNLLACILVKGYKVPRIISQVSDINHKEAFKEVGIDIIINPELTAANYIEKRIIRPNIADLTVLGKGDAEILDFTIQKGKYVGKRIADINPDDNFNIVAVYENGDIIMPKPDIVLKSGVKISIIVKTKFAEDVLKHFTEDTEIEILPGIKLE